MHNLKYLKSFRKDLRNHGTSAEAVLWLCLKNRQLKGRKFRRQHSIGKYIIDFYSPAERLAIELDGATHGDLLQAEYDNKRTSFLNQLGVTVLRIENNRIFENSEDLLEYIASFFSDT